MTVFNLSSWHRPAVHLIVTLKEKKRKRVELLTLQPSAKTTTLGMQEAEKRGVKYMRVGGKALKWMAGWTPRLCSHELQYVRSKVPLLRCGTVSLTVLDYTVTKSNADPWFRSALLYNTVSSWKYGLFHVSF